MPKQMLSSPSSSPTRRMPWRKQTNFAEYLEIDQSGKFSSCPIDKKHIAEYLEIDQSVNILIVAIAKCGTSGIEAGL